MIEKEKKYLLNKILEIFGNDLTSVILFGSRVRKNYNDDSDVDIIIVVRKEIEDNKKIKKLRKEFLLKFYKKLDLHVFSEKEIISNLKIISPVFATLLLGKRILFDKNMFFQRAFFSFIREVAVKNIKYCEGGKIWEISKIAKNLENSL